MSRKIGSAVTNIQPGDRCCSRSRTAGSAMSARLDRRLYCTNFFEINFMGEPVFMDKSGNSIGGRFFGQSSFARHTIVSAKSIVNVRGMGLTGDDLRLLAPLGCGLQTGSGTVINVAKAGEDDAVAIVGMGGVGLAVMVRIRLSQQAERSKSC